MRGSYVSVILLQFTFGTQHNILLISNIVIINILIMLRSLFHCKTERCMKYSSETSWIIFQSITTMLVYEKVLKKILIIYVYTYIVCISIYSDLSIHKCSLGILYSNIYSQSIFTNFFTP